jgi:hypothetical protein
MNKSILCQTSRQGVLLKGLDTELSVDPLESRTDHRNSVMEVVYVGRQSNLGRLTQRLIYTSPLRLPLPYREGFPKSKLLRATVSRQVCPGTDYHLQLGTCFCSFSYFF